MAAENVLPDAEPSGSASVTIINEVRALPNDGSEWCLCFQWCVYEYGDGSSENGYRFIWRRPNGHLQAARGQARLPSRKVIEWLVAEATKQGWGDNTDGSPWQGIV